jgi:hypothetical protein
VLLRWVPSLHRLCCFTVSAAVLPPLLHGLDVHSMVTASWALDTPPPLSSSWASGLAQPYQLPS